jgi:hypothetical protein
MHACMNVCVYVCTHVGPCVYVCMHVGPCVYGMFVYMQGIRNIDRNISHPQQANKPTANRQPAVLKS